MVSLAAMTTPETAATTLPGQTQVPDMRRKPRWVRSREGIIAWVSGQPWTKADERALTGLPRERHRRPPKPVVYPWMLPELAKKRRQDKLRNLALNRWPTGTPRGPWMAGWSLDQHLASLGLPATRGNQMAMGALLRLQGWRKTSKGWTPR